jgi:hypothetical protein
LESKLDEDFDKFSAEKKEEALKLATEMIRNSGRYMDEITLQKILEVKKGLELELEPEKVVKLNSFASKPTGTYRDQDEFPSLFNLGLTRMHAQATKRSTPARSDVEAEPDVHHAHYAACSTVFCSSDPHRHSRTLSPKPENRKRSRLPRRSPGAAGPTRIPSWSAAGGHPPTRSRAGRSRGIRSGPSGQRLGRRDAPIESAAYQPPAAYARRRRWPGRAAFASRSRASE